MEKLSHDRLQQECFNYICKIGYKERFRGQNNNSHNKIKGALNQAIGIQKGTSDVIIFLDKILLCIEFKVGKDTQKKEQKEFEQIINNTSYAKYYIISTLEEFIKIITVWTI